MKNTKTIEKKKKFVWIQFFFFSNNYWVAAISRKCAVLAAQNIVTYNVLIRKEIYWKYFYNKNTCLESWARSRFYCLSLHFVKKNKQIVNFITFSRKMEFCNKRSNPVIQTYALLIKTYKSFSSDQLVLFAKYTLQILTKFFKNKKGEEFVLMEWIFLKEHLLLN